MRVLVIGGSGFLGRKLVQVFSKEHEVVGTYMKNKEEGLKKLDLSRRNEIHRVLSRFRPNLVMLASALTDVDYCELHQQEAYKVNIEGPENLLAEYKGKIIYISTDFVFDGQKGDYKETDKPNPINYYGYTKLEAEKIVSDSFNPYIIARVAYLYGLDKENKKFVNWAIAQMQNNRQVQAFNDKLVTPTFTNDIGYALSALVQANQQGLFHIAGTQSLSLYEMAQKIAQEFNFSKELVKPISLKGKSLAAKRPMNSTLNTEKIQSLGIRMSSFDEGVSILRKEMEVSL